MPRTIDQLETIRESRRAAILEAALVVFARHGYAGSSIRLIAQQAGIAQGLLYNYFPGKEALLLAIMERGMADVQASFVEADQAITPQAQLERLVRSSFALIQQHRDFWRLSYSVRMQPDVLAQLKIPIHDWNATILTTLERYLAAWGATNPPVEAALLFAQIDGAAQHYTIDPQHYPLNDVVEAIVAQFTSIDGGGTANARKQKQPRGSTERRG